MRNYIAIVDGRSPLVEAAMLDEAPKLAAAPPGHRRLYRGDSSKIEKFETAKTSLASLFGHGIYLTDNRRVAGDYTSKGPSQQDNDVLFRLSGRKLTKQAVLDYWLRRQASRMDVNGKPDFWGNEVRFSDGGDWGVVTNDLRRQEQEARMEFARAKWQKFSKDYEIRVKLDGTGVIQRKPKVSGGAVAAFDVPDAFIASCLHADNQIEGDVLSLLGYVLRKHGDGGTARDIDAYAKQQEWDGETPSFRDIYRSIGPDSPLSYEAEAQEQLASGLQDLGYTGIEYMGGISMGGGYKHRAFVFWDEGAINRCRVA